MLSFAYLYFAMHDQQANSSSAMLMTVRLNLWTLSSLTNICLNIALETVSGQSLLWINVQKFKVEICVKSIDSSNNSNQAVAKWLFISSATSKWSAVFKSVWSQTAEVRTARQ